MSELDLKIFTAGGTIDKVYFDAASDFKIGEPQISAILQEVGVSLSYEVESLMRKDSLEMDDTDRAIIARSVRFESCNKILITHGTDTMVETARHIEVEDKTVVFVGAMQPARFRVTDAVFNIGFAVAATQTLAPGVYVAMNGRVFDPAQVAKNRAAHRFESI